jgi:hypothetical protein
MKQFSQDLFEKLDHILSFASCWQDICLMGIVLISLNILDVLLTFHAVFVLGFLELNPLAQGFPVWLLVLKFSACFIPLVCAYVLEKLEMKSYLFLPFAVSLILIVFYAFVVAFNVCNILRA